MLHRLAQLDPIVRKAYADFDYAKVVAALSSFMNVDLSAFYFDIRKDALYCDAPSSATAARGARDGRTHLPLCDRLARADPRLHLRRGVGVARSNRRLGPSRAVPDRAGGMARRRARQALGGDPPRPLGRHRRAGEGARGEGDRLVARSAPARLRRRFRTEGGARRGRFRRSVHHFRSRPRLGRSGAGRRLPPGGRLRRRGRRRARARASNARAPGAISTRRPPTPTIPTSARATRRRCASSASSGGRDARARHRRRRHRRRRRARPRGEGAGARRFRRDRGGAGAVDAVPRSRLALEPRHFLQPVRAGIGGRALAAAGADR